jgi:hypothetical protein
MLQPGGQARGKLAEDEAFDQRLMPSKSSDDFEPQSEDRSKTSQTGTVTRETTIRPLMIGLISKFSSVIFSVLVCPSPL